MSSRLLHEAIASVYADLGLSDLNDPTFSELVVARIVEPVSKLETIRAVRELGLDAPSYSAICHCLRRCAREDHRERVQRRLLSHTPSGSSALLPCDLTTLFFEIQEEDD